MKKITKSYNKCLFITLVLWVIAFAMFYSCTTYNSMRKELSQYKQLKAVSDSIIYDDNYLDTHGDDLTASYLELSVKLNK